MSILNIKPDALTELRSQLVGTLLLPTDEQYHKVRFGFNLAVDQYPAFIVVANIVEDVSVAINFANEMDLGVAIQATGHGTILPADDAVLIITSQLKQLDVDSDNATAIIGAGLKWGQVLQETQKSGLTPLLGSSPEVGVVGYTLGGGMGWLARKYGLATDSVIYFDIVTSDGQFVRASAEDNPDLFWGLRGGGGNFGVVVAMKIRLYPVSTVYGGNLFYSVDDAEAVFKRYRQWVVDAPEELTSAVVLMNYPPIPEMPDILRGKSYVMIRGCCTDVEMGEQLLTYWREWKQPIIDDFKVMPFTAVASISSDPVDPLPGRSTGAWLREINDDVIDTLTTNVPGHTPVVFAEIRHAGGAIRNVDPAAAAFGNRDANFSLQMIGVIPTPEAANAYEAYTWNIKQGMQSALTGGVYPNFVEGQEAYDRTRDAYSDENYGRLQTIKSRYDAKNRFRHSYNLELQ